MKFELTAEQRDFRDSLESLLAAADTVKVGRAWAAGDHEPGLALWRRLADLGVNTLLVPEDDGGLGATPVELCVAFEALGRHAVPGPWIESVAYLRLADGSLGTVAVPPHTPYALDADVAEQVLVAGPDGLRTGTVGVEISSVDPTRRLFEVEPGPASDVIDQLDQAFDLAALATAAELLGAGERVLADAVAYVKQRTQFGRTIGSYQSIKHQLANVRIALDFARPLVFGAAVDPSPRAVSAAKVQSADAANLAARVGLQVHGAIGYTDEYDLSRWLLRIRALQSAWGTPAFHRERLLADLLTTRDAS
jgi:alkylation response protein AidB-like acyl-CoA dehydrogenase